MKTATLPPLRVSPALKKDIEDALQEGESLSAFMLEAVARKAQVRKEQRAFVQTAMRRAEKAKRTGRHVPAEAVFERLEQALTRAKRNHKRP